MPHADTCLPDYWGGHHLPHVAVPVSRDTTFADLCSMIIDELREGAMAGDATLEETYEDEDWYYSAIRAVMCDVQPRDHGNEYPFRDLDTGDFEHFTTGAQKKVDI